MYRLHFHEDVGYLETELVGFWTLDELATFDRQIIHCMRKYAVRFPNFPILCDSRAFAVQSAEVSEAFAVCSTASAERHSGLVAIVIDSALARFQAKRLVDQTWTRRFFTDMDEARAWIEADAGTRSLARRRA